LLKIVTYDGLGGVVGELNARALLTRGAYREALAALEPLPSDPATRIGSLICQAQLFRYLSRRDEGLTAAREAVRLARAHHHPGLGGALSGFAFLEELCGRRLEAVPLAIEALACAQAVGDRRAESEACRLLGRVRIAEGGEWSALMDQAVKAGEAADVHHAAVAHLDYARALRLLDPGGEQTRSGFEQALARFLDSGDPSGETFARLELAGVARKRGDLAEARAQLDAAAVSVTRSEYTSLGAIVDKEAGDLAWMEGDGTRAEMLYRQALAKYPPGAGSAMICRVSLALALLQRDEFEEADGLIQQCVAAANLGVDSVFGGVLHACALVPAAARGDWEAFELAVGRARVGLHDTARSSLEAAWACDRAADLIEPLLADAAAEDRAVLGSRAIRCLQLAGRLRSRWGGEVDVDRIAALARSGVGLPLGPFDLHHRIGRGATGVVWRGVHRASGTPVAVKVLRGGSAREVQAIASLDHPHIVRLLDAGMVTEPIPGALDAGGTWLALELAEGGTVRAACGRMSWAAVRSALLELLDALAHAHARGVLHLDLKPDNVLLDGGRVKLTDFGIAHLLSDRSGAPRQGTPAYMAPEQVLGHWRDLSPATDLYALGCTAVAMLTGAPPYEGTPTQLAQQHVDAPLPPTDGPPGFDAWVRRLMHKSPASRFQTAAEAARALPGAFGGAASTTRSPTQALPTLDLSMLEFDLPSIPRGRAAPTHVPPVPSDWRRPRHHHIPPSDAGLGLLSVRDPGLVGREAERDQLWSALREVSAHREPRLVVLRGAEGVGKRALGRWLGERGAELGLARVAVAHHHPLRGPEHGIAGLVRSFFRSHDLSGEELERRVRPRVGEAWPAVRAMLEELDAPRDALRAGLHRLVFDFARDRAGVVRVENAQWGADSLRWIAELWAVEPRLAVVFVITVREADLNRQPEAAGLLSALEQLPHARTLRIAPLDEEGTRRALGQLLPLTPTLERDVVTRSGGNPGFARQLVTAWVDGGLLLASADGYRMRPGAQPAVPEAPLAIWLGRVDEVVARFGGEARVALEVASAFGAAFDQQIWAAATRVPEGLGDYLSDARLFTVRPDGNWVFAHGGLREALLHHAAERGVLAERHAACAAVVEDPARLAHHLVAAGRFGEAIAPMLLAIDSRRLAGDLLGAAPLVDLAERTWRRLGLPDDDPGAAPIVLMRALLADYSGDDEAAVAYVERCLAIATDDVCRATALDLRARHQQQ
jgi:serine/threonine protein kinase/tetratricopeptide (TPR) repeat protein